MRFIGSGHTNDETLSSLIDGRLGASERARVEAHAEGCARCRDALEGLRAVRSALAALPPERAPHSFALREADVRSAPPTAARGFAWATPALSGIASLALIAFLTLASIDAFGGVSVGGGGTGGDALLGEGATSGDYAPAPDEGSRRPQGVAEDAADDYSDPEQCLNCAENDVRLSYSTSLLRNPELYGPPRPNFFGPPRPAGLPATRGLSGNENDDMALRIAESVAAATALVSIAGLAFLWRRRHA